MKNSKIVRDCVCASFYSGFQRMWIVASLVFSSLWGEGMKGNTVEKVNAEEKQRVLFLVNPISHEIKGQDVQKIIEETVDRSKFSFSVVYTQYPGHATELTREAIEAGVDIVAAVGGDGTVNEVGRALLYSKTALAIIPVGSGNGLARHLRIPVGLRSSIGSLNSSEPVCADSAKINDHLFLGIAGIGFDAQIAHQFAQFGRRGFFSYCRVALREFVHYHPEQYHLVVDGKEMDRKAFILSFANSSQYGNDCAIAPGASLSDGLLDLVIVDRIPILKVIPFFYRLTKGTIDRQSHFESLPFRELTIKKQRVQGHIDGEPVILQDEIHVVVQPRSLLIMAPPAASS